MLILQSASPRRKELLHKITDDFRVESVPANECVIPSRPAATVMKNAREKALAIKQYYHRRYIQDTLVSTDV